jgi:predicted RNase H-like HicB family nuclease
MPQTRKTGKLFQCTALIDKDGEWYIATCPELEVVSQGETVEVASKNLAEAVSIVLEEASPRELKRRKKSESYVARLEVPVG